MHQYDIYLVKCKSKLIKFPVKHQLVKGSFYVSILVLSPLKHGKASCHTPYSKIAENTFFFCLQVNWPLLPIPLNSVDGIKATKANKQ